MPDNKWTTGKKALLGMFIGAVLSLAILAAAMAVAGFVSWVAS